MLRDKAWVVVVASQGRQETREEEEKKKREQSKGFPLFLFPAWFHKQDRHTAHYALSLGWDGLIARTRISLFFAAVRPFLYHVRRGSMILDLCIKALSLTVFGG